MNANVIPVEARRTGRPPMSAELFIVDPVTGCWVWQRAKNHRGYGLMWDGEKMHAAHRLFYMRAKGAIPEGHQLDHLCRNRACVNPAHLEPVTPAENTQRGNVAKLNPDQVAQIRERRAGGESVKSLSGEFGVTTRQIYRVASGERWMLPPAPARPASPSPVRPGGAI